MIESGTKLVRNGSIEVADMGDEIGMLNEATGRYYILNGIGSDIWNVIDEPISFEMLVEQLLGLYDIDKSTCEKETMEFVVELVTNELIRIVD